MYFGTGKQTEILYRKRALMKKTASKRFFSTYRIVILVLMAMVIAWQYRHFIFSRNEVERIILISIDTCRADYLGCYGFDRPTTPNIDAVADEAVLFEQVIAPVPYTLPSHSSMLTGTIPPYHGVHDNVNYRLHEANVTLAEVLKQRRYTTGSIVSTIVMDVEYGLGQGFDDYYDVRTPEESGSVTTAVERKAEPTTELAIDWLDEHKEDNFFLFLHYYDPHWPYEPPEPFATDFADNLYAGEIAYVDHCIGRLVDKLKEQGLYDSTLLIITSDHGEGLGEHGESQHGFFIYQSTLGVPLIMKLPGQSGGKRVGDVAALVDITPTVCSLAGIPASPGAQSQGGDLSPYLLGNPGKKEKRYIYAESLGPTHVTGNSLFGIVEGDWKYIQTTRPELYNLKLDPGELVDRVEAEPRRAQLLKKQLQNILDDLLRRGRSRIDADPQRLQDLHALGYIGGPVEESFEFNQDIEDPKDLIWVHEQMLLFEDAVSRKDQDEVKRICTYILSRKPDFCDGHNFLARIAKDQGDLPEAERHWKESLNIRSDQADVLNSLGKVLALQDKTAEAIGYWTKAQEQQPDNEETHYNLGVAHNRLGQYEEAIKHWRKSLAIVPDQSNVTNWLARSHKKWGDKFRLQSQFPQALEQWLLSLELNSNQPDVLNNVGWAYTVKGTAFYNPKEAVRSATRACELTGHKNPAILNTLAGAFASQGEWTKAVEVLKKAIDLAASTGQTQLQVTLEKHLKSYQDEQLTD
jgi:arylsulfatase A-like enzyme/Tfp pilus assembly protein PilF